MELKDAVFDLQHFAAIGVLQRRDQPAGVLFVLSLDGDVARRETFSHMNGGDFTNQRAFLRNHRRQASKLTWTMARAHAQDGVDTLTTHGTTVSQSESAVSRRARRPSRLQIWRRTPHCVTAGPHTDWPLRRSR